ncbi:hypothetical protein AKJ16_DCAP22251, partial [Drosera capensis]
MFAVNRPEHMEEVSEGILMEMAKRVLTNEDFESIRGVNRHWRSSLKDFHYSYPAPRVPWRMLVPDGSDIIINDYGDEVEIRRFFDFTNGKIGRVLLPEQIRKRRCLSSNGWLLT